MGVTGQSFTLSLDLAGRRFDSYRHLAIFVEDEEGAIGKGWGRYVGRDDFRTEASPGNRVIGKHSVSSHTYDIDWFPFGRTGQDDATAGDSKRHQMPMRKFGLDSKFPIPKVSGRYPDRGQ